MKLSKSLREAVVELPEPSSLAAYFQGRRRAHACALDDILLFARRDVGDLLRRSAASRLHRRFVLVVCLETAGMISVDGIPFALKPGQAHLVFPESYHHFQQLERTSILWLLITFEAKEAERLSVLRQRTLDLQADDDRLFLKMISQFNAGAATGKGDELYFDLAQLLCRWCEEVSWEGTMQLSPSAQEDSGLWRRLQVQLEKLSPDELRVGPLAAKLAISERHLRQRFRDHFGVSLGVYLRNYRIRRAIGLLVSSELSQAEIADRCGYQSSASFHRAFTKHTGMGPAEFRKASISAERGLLSDS